ncbi:hypothetical protein [Stenotrophomonas beteli]|uniref:Rap1a immunity protein domain-containing protein n=1 Tax=Stenotrophomonas beteli TaxID=3384461 RepID=A0A0R0AW76_9GAMM|nr:hypothetical protein [Stenotrophomonas maltophilia]KRG49302.1 hypothetical protein ARC23_14550 [Stenotrophomonas maltophilia]
MKTCVLALALMTVFPFSANALSVENYRKVKAQSESSDEMESKVARLILTGYFQGVEEVLFGQRSYSADPIKVTGDLHACVPSSVTIDAALLRTALDQEIGRHAKIYEDVPDWEQTYAANFAMLGIARMFPCDQGKRPSWQKQS